MFSPFNRPAMPSMGDGPTAVNPQYPQQPNEGGNGMRQGWLDYLTAQGWDGQGMPFQYAQQLRAQGEHPRWDYRHPGQEWPGSGMNGPNGGQMPGQFPGGLGQLGSGAFGGGQFGNGQGFPGAYGYEPPHPILPSYDGSGINPGGVFSQPQSFASGGLMDLARGIPSRKQRNP